LQFCRMKIAAILVAAGSGSRFGGETPKQFMPLGGKPVIAWAASALLPHVTFLQPVGDRAAIETALAGIPHLPVVPGGALRQNSVRAGLEALAPYAPDLVLVHDAARPFAPAAMIKALIAALAANEAAIPAVPVADTLKRGEGALVAGTVPRDGLYRVQTPQAFRFQTLLDLHRNDTSGLATDDAYLCEQSGIGVALVPGAEYNFKITYKSDFARMERLLMTEKLPHMGTGYDVHVLEENRKLMLCGVEVPHEFGLAGHSDADVGIHALCDAIYGALAEGDIGRHFPPSEDEWKNADSARFLRHAAERVRARNGQIVNVDVTIICERPKIMPHADRMRARLADLLDIPVGKVSVKATTTERLGFTGRGEGIAAQAAAVVMLPE
jgi:2-C-methyl-D-erythritol 4-phosphate cytidylyltransferase/2-C-methyl-D-erythritol 2,4-cyclodiphosphate synthase